MMKRNALLLLALCALMVLPGTLAVAAPNANIAGISLDPEDAAWGFLAAALAVLGSCMAAGLALRTIASAGFAAAAERPELKTYILILGGLAEGIAIYGLLIAIMILGKI